MVFVLFLFRILFHFFSSHFYCRKENNRNCWCLVNTKNEEKKKKSFVLDTKKNEKQYSGFQNNDKNFVY